jgi:Domain of unknown function (DUF4824)
MKWTRRHTLAAGLGLIALTNAVALVGAAWNRSGEEAKLRLTQRELQRPYIWYGNRENSGISLRLIWRLLIEPSGATEYFGWSYAGAGGAPSWLDGAKMKSLGFDVSDDAEKRVFRRFERRLPREVLLVLELDGPARQRMLALGAEYVARQEAKLAASPGDKFLQQLVNNGREQLERQKQRESRLFVVDAGLDATALRAQYPERGRYAIVRGEVTPATVNRKSGPFSGYVTGVSVAEINVPLEFRSVFASSAPAYDSGQSSGAPFEAVVAFGKRLEPWIVEAARK